MESLQMGLEPHQLLVDCILDQKHSCLGVDPALVHIVTQHLLEPVVDAFLKQLLKLGRLSLHSLHILLDDLKMPEDIGLGVLPFS